MGLFVNLKGKGRKDSESNKNIINEKAEILIDAIRDSIEIARTSPDLEIKKAKLKDAMKKVIHLMDMANHHPFLVSKKLSAIYVSIREIRNEIKAMESKRISFDKREVA